MSTKLLLLAKIGYCIVDYKIMRSGFSEKEVKTTSV